jgi:hypothetical protein
MAVDKRLLIDAALVLAVSILTLLRVCAGDDLVVRHVDGCKC